MKFIPGLEESDKIVQKIKSGIYGLNPLLDGGINANSMFLMVVRASSYGFREVTLNVSYEGEVKYLGSYGDKFDFQPR